MLFRLLSASDIWSFFKYELGEGPSGKQTFAFFMLQAKAAKGYGPKKTNTKLIKPKRKRMRCNVR